MEGNGGNDWKPCKSRPIPNRFFDWLFNSYLHYINYVVRLHLFFGEHLPDGRSESSCAEWCCRACTRSRVWSHGARVHSGCCDCGAGVRSLLEEVEVEELHGAW